MGRSDWWIYYLDSADGLNTENTNVGAGGRAWGPVDSQVYFQYNPNAGDLGTEANWVGLHSEV
jgi:hypothetical protein